MNKKLCFFIKTVNKALLYLLAKNKVEIVANSNQTKCFLFANKNQVFISKKLFMLILSIY